MESFGVRFFPKLMVWEGSSWKKMSNVSHRYIPHEIFSLQRLHIRRRGAQDLIVIGRNMILFLFYWCNWSLSKESFWVVINFFVGCVFHIHFCTFLLLRRNWDTSPCITTQKGLKIGMQRRASDPRATMKIKTTTNTQRTNFYPIQLQRAFSTLFYSGFEAPACLISEWTYVYPCVTTCNPTLFCAHVKHMYRTRKNWVWILFWHTELSEDT